MAGREGKDRVGDKGKRCRLKGFMGPLRESPYYPLIPNGERRAGVRGALVLCYKSPGSP